MREKVFLFDSAVLVHIPRLNRYTDCNYLQACGRDYSIAICKFSEHATPVKEVSLYSHIVDPFDDGFGPALSL